MTALDSHTQSSDTPIRHEGFLRHKRYRYLKAAVVISIVSIIVYLFVDVEPRHNGGTWYGYTLGTISTLLIVWLMLIGLRKRAITPGHWNLKGWTSAHVYLGASLLVLATLHTGFQFGLNVHTLAYTLMVFVIISGFYGVYFYATTPRRMSDNRAQRSQAELLTAIRSIDRQLREAAQPLDPAYVREVKRAISKTKIRPGLFTSISATQKRCATTHALKRLRHAAPSAPEEMRRPLEDIMAILERKNALLLRTRRHIRFTTLLRLWLHFHVPLAFALLAALVAHIVSVFFFW